MQVTSIVFGSHGKYLRFKMAVIIIELYYNFHILIYRKNINDSFSWFTICIVPIIILQFFVINKK